MLCASAHTLSTLALSGPASASPAPAAAAGGGVFTSGCALVSAGAVSAVASTTASHLNLIEFMASRLARIAWGRIAVDWIQVPGHDIPVRASFQVRVQILP